MYVYITYLACDLQGAVSVVCINILKIYIVLSHRVSDDLMFKGSAVYVFNAVSKNVFFGGYGNYVVFVKSPNPFAEYKLASYSKQESNEQNRPVGYDIVVPTDEIGYFLLEEHEDKGEREEDE